MSPALPRRFPTATLAVKAAFAAALALAAPPARAQAAPTNYQEMMTAAPEILGISVVSVDTTPGKDGVQVSARATVTGVTRSATGLKAGDTIALSYAHVTAPPGADTPALLAQGRSYIAFLASGPAPAPYMPAARGKSFSETGGASAAGPVWPTPAKPTPPGWSRQNLADVKSYLVVKSGENYFAQPPGAAATARVPLLAGATAPVLLHLYTSAQSAASAPRILVYRAGTMEAGAPINGPITIDRAVIFVPNSAKPLGDALWAVTPAPGARALPQPIWIWGADKLVVENPFERTRQEVALPGK